MQRLVEGRPPHLTPTEDDAVKRLKDNQHCRTLVIYKGYVLSNISGGERLEVASERLDFIQRMLYKDSY